MAQALTLAAPITRVEIFRDGALVHRRAVLETNPGPEHRLRLAGLPLALRESSLRVALEPANACRLAGVRLGLDIEAPPPAEEVAEVEQVRELKRQITLLRIRRDNLQKDVEALKSLSPDLPPYPQDPEKQRFITADPTPGWLACGEFAQAQSLRCLNEAAGLEPQLRDLEEKLRVAEERLALLSRQRQQQLCLHRELDVVLSGPLAKPAALLLSYQIPGACWYPAYEIRVTDSGDSAELSLSALVAQATGEDWDDVAIHLSTANLARGNDLPELAARRIGRSREDAVKSAWRPLPEDLGGLFTDFDRLRPARPGIIPDPAELPALTLGPFSQVESLPAEEAQFPDRTPAGEVIDPSPVEAGDIDMLCETAEEEDTCGQLDQVRYAMPAPPPPPPSVAPASKTAPAPPPQPAMAMSAKAEGAAFARKARASDRAKTGARREERPSTPAGLIPEAGLLSYDELLLPPADAPERGALRPRQPFEQLPGAWRRSPRAARLLEAELQRLARLMTGLQNLALPRHVCPVAESAGHFAHVYRTTLARAIPADGQLHRIPVLRAALPLKLFYRTLPLADAAAYRVADIENTLDLPMLAGPIDIYWGADYLVTGRLATAAPRARIDLHLGVEPSIKVARNVRHQESQSGLSNPQTLYEEEISIEVESHLPRSIFLEVIERLPVSGDDRLKICVKEIQPAAEEYKQTERGQPVEGGRRWRVELQPGQKELCLLRYGMELPVKTEIVGGGRRA